MANLPVCTIPGNPDIAGIGVRVAIYSQVIIAAVAIIYTWTRVLFNSAEVDKYDLENTRLVSQVGRTLLVTGLALIVSALIEVRAGLTIYHTLVVLNLSWVNNMTGFTLHLFPWLIRRDFGTSIWRSLLKDFWLFTVHSTLMSILGLWLWSSPRAYAERAAAAVATAAHGAPAGPCAPLTYYWAFGPMDAFSPKLRDISLAVYSLTLIPILSILIHAAPALIPLFFLSCGRLHAAIKTAVGLLWTLICVATIIGPPVFFVVATEKFIALNRPYVDQGVEDRWTFGQMLALLSAMISAGFVVMDMRNVRAERKSEEKSGLLGESV